MTSTRRAGALLAAFCGVALGGCNHGEAEAPLPVAVVAQASIPPLDVVVASRIEEPAIDDVPTPPQQAAVPPAPEASAPPPPAPAPVIQPAQPPRPAPEPARIEKPSVATYEPPFPDRVDLFVAPKREGGAAATPGTTDTAVELMGFVRVADLKAVVSINGEVAPMGVGESRFGVEIISISPPNIVLQRGRQRWQATLD